MGKIKHIVFFLLLSSQTFGQTVQRKSFFFELAGSGGLASLNFEKSFLKKSNTEFTWRAGFSLAPIDRNNGTGLVFPLMIHSMSGKGPHKLELGLGQGLTITTKGSFFILTTASIGYRYQPEAKKYFYRVTYTPLISYLVDFQVQQWAGLSIGYTFNRETK